MPSILILGSDYHARQNMYNKINSNGKFDVLFCSPYFANLYKPNTIYDADRVACDIDSKLEYFINMSINSIQQCPNELLTCFQTCFPKAIILFNPNDETLKDHGLLL
jgi:hypothetical protein